MRIKSINCNGLKAAYNRDNFLGIFDDNPEVVMLQETKCSEARVGYWLCEHDQYVPYSASNLSIKGYAGVTTLVRRDLVNKVLSCSTPVLIGSEYDSGRIVTLEFDKFFLVNVYVLNSGSYKEALRKQWDTEFITYVAHLDTQKPVILLGDFNVCHTEMDHYHFDKYFDNHPGLYEFEIEDFNNLLFGARLVDVYRDTHQLDREYTWFSNFGNSRENNNGWRLDYALVSKELYIDYPMKSSIMNDAKRSDHSLIELEIDDSILVEQRFSHYKKGGSYRVVGTCKIQENDKWYDAVIYEDPKKGRFVRKESEFYDKLITL